MKKRAGDTLVEVALAIGIFSMVAIAVVSVMTGGTSSAETALETTLAREEIDVQAEALRFVHSAYIAGADSDEESPYVELWDKIVEKAIDPSTDNTNYLEYAPRTCQEVQDSDTLKNHGFIINPRALGSRPSEAYVGYNNDNFKTASTFPRLIYSANDGNESLLDSTGSNLYRAEGIYVIAVKDASTTQIVGTTSPSLSSGFYDFYIRTCWYGVGEDTPSTISTVIRLYDPPEAVNRNKSRVTIVYMSNGGPSVPVARQIVYPGESVDIARYTNNAGFIGWNTRQNLTGNTIAWPNNKCTINGVGNVTANGSRCIYTAPTLSRNTTLYLYAMWNEEIKIRLDWGMTHNDLDSYVYGSRTDGRTFTANYQNTQASFIAGQPAIATLDHDCQGSLVTFNTCRDETFTINTLGGEKYYYYVKNYTNKNSNITDATVKVTSSGKLNLNKTFTASNATGNGGAWNVFALIDDKIIPCEIRTDYNSPNISYSSPCRPFTIQFNGNGNTGGSMANQTINYGTSAALANNAFSRTGYTFNGWNTKANGTGTSYSNRASYRAPASANSGTLVTLYAQWKKIQYSPNQKYYMQDFTIDHCASLASAGDYTIYDRRDEKSYTVRYINGVCWMTQNLNIYQNIPSNQSNFTSPSSFDVYDSSVNTFNYAASIANALAGAAQACASTPGCVWGGWGIGDIGNLIYGNAIMVNTSGSTYYNPLAAYVGGSTWNNADICPKGWRIASSQNYQNVYSANKSSLLKLSNTGYVSNYTFFSISSGYYLTSDNKIGVYSNGTFAPDANRGNAPTYSIRCVVK